MSIFFRRWTFVIFFLILVVLIIFMINIKKNTINFNQVIKLHRKNRTYVPPKLPDRLKSAAQDNQEIIQNIQQNWILPPPKQHNRTFTRQSKDFSQLKQSTFLDNFMKKKTGGFYIECGAYNGVDLSNTLFFEQERNWQGLLIEADPYLFEDLLEKHRNAYLLHACISPSPNASLLDFTIADPEINYLSGLKDHLLLSHKEAINKQENFIIEKVQCFPFYSILAAMGSRHVDFFSLDIEGAEVEVLRTIPLSKVDIDMFLIEVQLWNAVTTHKKIQDIKAILEPAGYKVINMPENHLDLLMSKI